jgi:hypothetical protein
LRNFQDLFIRLSTNTINKPPDEVFDRFTYGVAKIAKPPVEISEIRLNVEKFVWWSPEK